MSSAIVTNILGQEAELFSCSGDVRTLHCGDADKAPAQLQYISAEARKDNVVAVIIPGYRDDVMSAVRDCSKPKPKIGVVYNMGDKLVEGTAKRLGQEPGYVKRWIESVSAEGFDVLERTRDGNAHIVDETLCDGLADILSEWDYI